MTSEVLISGVHFLPPRMVQDPVTAKDDNGDDNSNDNHKKHNDHMYYSGVDFRCAFLNRS